MMVTLSLVPAVFSRFFFRTAITLVYNLHQSADPFVACSILLLDLLNVLLIFTCGLRCETWTSVVVVVDIKIRNSIRFLFGGAFKDGSEDWMTPHRETKLLNSIANEVSV